jgi:hypothetical protein
MLLMTKKQILKMVLPLFFRALYLMHEQPAILKRQLGANCKITTHSKQMASYSWQTVAQ